ncbi:MAG: EAL domain-containing protein [Stappiaceae bacterium]
MSRRYALFVKAVGLALLLAVAPLVAAKYVLDYHAETVAREDMRSTAERYVMRAEQTIKDAVSTLQMLHRDGAITCAPNHRRVFSQKIGNSAYIQRIGLVDADGVSMCLAPTNSRIGQDMLPVYQNGAPPVGIGLLDKSFHGAHVGVVSWHVANGVRLVAEISPASVLIEPGYEILKSKRYGVLRLANNVVWLVVGEEGNIASLPPEDIIVADYHSGRYPIDAKFSLPADAALAISAELKFMVAVASAGFAVLFVAIALWVSWRPEQDAEDEFVAAIRNGEFIPYYQPVMDIETGRLRGCEVLMRWKRPDGSIVSPGQFMTFAETSGHIFEMTRQVMRRTCEEVSDLHVDNPDLKLSVNLFAGHFEDRQIIEDLKEIYGNSKIAYQNLVMEVTERQPLQDMEKARKIIAEMQSLGVRLALDDCGTGHGGLAYLQKLGIDIIKIDKMFIDSLGMDASSATIVDTLVELAGNLGMGIIAEGVENIDQIERLRELGVTAAQGYIFAPPLPAKLYVELANALMAGQLHEEIVDDGPDVAFALDSAVAGAA